MNFSAKGIILSCLPASVTILRNGKEITESLDNTVRFRKLENCNGFAIQSSYHNYSMEPVYLRRFNLIDAALELESQLSDWRFLPIGTLGRKAATLAESIPSTYGAVRSMWQSFNLEPPKLQTHPRYDDPRWRDSCDVAGIYRNDGAGVLVGAIGPGISFGEISIFVEGENVRLLATSEMDDILVEPGESRLSEEIMLLEMPGAQAMEKWTSMIAAKCGSRTHRPPITGWCSWYNDKWKNVEVDDIKGVIEAVQKNPEQLRFDVIQIDDGYQKNVGDWRTNERFPEGMTKLAKEIEAVGAMPGLWIAPMIANDSLDMFKDHPDWFQRDSEGDLCGYPLTNWGGNSYFLDPTHPEVKEFIRKVVRDSVDAGYKYLKIDFSEVIPGAKLYDPKKTRFEAMIDIYKLYRETMGDDIYFLAGGVGASSHRSTVGIVDASRISTDSTAIWESEWGIREAIRGVLFRQAMHKMWWVNDPDVTYLEPYRELSEKELKTWTSVVGLSGGTTGISELLGSRDYSRSYRSFEILAPPVKELARPLDLGENEYPKRFGFKIVRSWGDAAVVMLWNCEHEAESVDIAFEKLGLSSDKQYHVWSFWDESYLGVAKNSWNSPILEPKSCVVIKITEVEKIPTIVGSNLHIGCGAAEIAKFDVSPETICIELSAAGARNGALWIHSSSDIAICESKGCKATCQKSADEEIYKISIESRNLKSKQMIILSNK